MKLSVILWGIPQAMRACALAYPKFKESLKEQLLAEFEDMTDQQFFLMFDQLEIETHREIVLQTGARIDGRG